MSKHQQYDKYKRNQESRSFYKSKAWEKCRQIVLNRDNHLCQGCLKQGKITAADMVHHIEELKDKPSKALDVDNLTSLCNPCHNSEHSVATKKVSKKIRVIMAKKNPEIF